MTDQNEIDSINEWLAVPSVAMNAITQATEPEQSHAMEGVSAAAVAWAKEQHNYAMVVNATKIYLLARRKTTELLLADNMRVINDVQFTPMQWSRRLKEYKIPNETLDSYFDGCISKGWNPSIAGVLKEAYPGETKEKQAAEVVEVAEYGVMVLRQRIKDLKDAVKFYATRYHDENHQSASFMDCQSDVCQTAAKLVETE